MRIKNRLSTLALAVGLGLMAPVMVAVPAVALQDTSDDQLSPLAVELINASGQDTAAVEAIITRENAAGNGAALRAALTAAIQRHAGVEDAQAEVGRLALAATNVAIAADDTALMADVARQVGALSPSDAAAIVTQVAIRGSAGVATAYVNNVSYDRPVRRVRYGTTQTQTPVETTETPTVEETPVVTTPTVTTPTVTTPTVTTPTVRRPVIPTEPVVPIVPEPNPTQVQSQVNIIIPVNGSGEQGRDQSASPT